MPLWQGMIVLSTITLMMGGAALYHCFLNITKETTYCLVLFGMCIPNIIGDAYITSWLIKDNNNSRDSLVSGVALNLMGVIA